MMRKVAGNGYVAVVDCLDACRMHPCDELDISIRLGVVLVTGHKRASPQWHTENVICEFRDACHAAFLDISLGWEQVGPHCGGCADQEFSTFHVLHSCTPCRLHHRSRTRPPKDSRIDALTFVFILATRWQANPRFHETPVLETRIGDLLALIKANSGMVDRHRGGQHVFSAAIRRARLA